MSFVKARMCLVWTFIIGLSTQCLAIIAAFCSRAISTADLIDLLKLLLSIYSIHFAVILGSIFGKSSAMTGTKKVASLPFRMSMSLSVLWNLMLIWRTLQFGINAFDTRSTDSTALLVSYLSSVAGASSFLVAGALAFVFGRSD
jgi:hypothetical protein